MKKTMIPFVSLFFIALIFMPACSKGFYKAVNKTVSAVTYPLKKTALFAKNLFISHHKLHVEKKSHGEWIGEAVEAENSVKK